MDASLEVEGNLNKHTEVINERFKKYNVLNGG